MQIIRTVIWVLVLVALGLFSLNNWAPVEVKLWEGIILETKLPLLVLTSFLMGLLPMWLLHKGTRWRLNRRIGLLENTVKATSVSTPSAVATSTQLEAAADKPESAV
jgi:lipopolysaccharide assembly protein A